MADDIASQLEGAVESLGRFRDSLEDNNIRMGNASSIEAKIHKLEVDKLKLLEKANKAEGKRMKDLASGMGKAAQSMGKLATKLGVVGGILTMFKGVVDVLLKVDRHAAKFSKQLGETRASAKGLFNEVTKVEGSLQAVGINLGEALHTAGALAQEFGQMSRVTSEMVDQTAKYSKAFGTSTEEAAKLTEHLTRSGVSMDFIDKGLKSAFLTGNNLGVVFRDLTKNAGMIELYLTRGEDSILDMANRAAALGGSLESFGKMADAWSDVESIGENIGKTAQLFGSSFEDGLGDLTELYTMYQNFQDDKLHERITEQLAKTMVLEGDILKIRKQQADGTFKTFNLTRAHVEQASKLYGGDKEFMMRSVKAQKQMEMTQKTMNLLDEEGKKLSLDKFMALQDAHRLATKGQENAKALHELDKEALKSALTAARQQMKNKEKQVDEATKIENILSAQAGIWTKLLNLVKQVTEPLETVVSKLFDENVMEGLNKHLTTLSEKVKVIFSTGEGGAFNTGDISDELSKEDGGIGSALKLMGDRLAKSFAEQFNIKTKDNETITSWKQLMKTGWETLKPYLESAEEWMSELFGRVFKSAFLTAITPDAFTNIGSGISSIWDSFGSTQEEIDARRKGRGYNEGGWLDFRPEKPKSTNALGRIGGGRHRGIVGEAGTEVGITRSALRELASAGIPGYQGGYYGGARTGRTGTFQAPGSMGARGQRTADNQAVGAAYRRPQQEFLQRLWQNQYSFLNEERDITEMRYRDQKEFFIKYPAVVDEALGRPFREAGGAAEGIYNAIFSGMQAGVRAEFAGATAERQREIAFQHAVAEGIKEGGIINQGLDKLAKWSEKIYNNGKDITTADRAQIGLLGGIQHGLQAMAGVIASGGSREQALEMGKRGAIGGIVKDLTASFGGKADTQFLETMDMMGYLIGSKKLPVGTGRSTGDMITEAFDRTERTFQSQGRGLGWGGANAQGRVFNSPHLAVVGEGSQNEIIVPTERIRKGLPINEGVARELGSIGVPGYENGYSFMDRFKMGREAQQLGIGPGFSMGTSGGGGYAGRLGHSYQSMGGASGGLATAGLQFANTYMQTGDMGMAAGQALGAGIGFGATIAISAIPGVGPFIGPILGPMIGSFIGGKLAGALGYKPKHGKYRERTLKLLENHVLTEGLFDHGQPGGAKDLIEKAISGGKKKHPSEEHFEKLKTAVSGSKVLKRGFMTPGVNGEGLLALLSGQVGNTDQENQMYARYNNAFYGSATPMAKGGIVTKPTNAIVGEAGPEAVIPLNQHGGYASRQQMQDQKEMIGELRKQNQQMGMFIKNMGDSKTVLQVDGRQLAETVGSNMYDMNQGV